MAIESEGILYSKNRLLEAMEFKIVSGMEMVDLDPLGVNTRTPIIDRYSPLAYMLLHSTSTMWCQAMQVWRPAIEYPWRESSLFKESLYTGRFLQSVSGVRSRGEGF